MSTRDPAGGSNDPPTTAAPMGAEPRQRSEPPFPGEAPGSFEPPFETDWSSSGDQEGPYEGSGYAPERWPGWADTSGYDPGFETEYDDNYLEEPSYVAYTGEPGSYPADAAYADEPGDFAAYAGEPRAYTTSPGHRRSPRERRPSGPWPELVMITAVAVIVAAVALAVTSANHPQLTSTSTSDTATSTAGKSVLTAPGGAGHPPAASKTPSSTRPSSAKTSGSASSNTPHTSNKGPHTSATRRHTKTTVAHVLARNLIISPVVKHQLVETWVATNPGGLGLALKDVAGTARGEVYYGYDVSISTYFAIAAFQPSALVLKKASTTAGKAELRAFQDTQYVFSLQTGSTWTELGIVATGSCPGEWVPTAVLAVWGMCGLRPPPT